MEPSQLLSYLPYSRALHSGPIGKHTNWQPAIPEGFHAGLLAGVFVILQLDPLERHIAAMQEIAKHVTQGGSGCAENPDLRKLICARCFLHVFAPNRPRLAASAQWRCNVKKN